MANENILPTDRQPDYVLTPKLISEFEMLSNGKAATDPREQSYNGVSGFDLYKAWEGDNFMTGQENDAVKYSFTPPKTAPESSSPVARLFRDATGNKGIDYVDNPIKMKPIVPEPASIHDTQPISIFGSDPVQSENQPTALDNATAISKQTGVTYDSPLLSYSDRSKLLKQRMNYG